MDPNWEQVTVNVIGSAPMTLWRNKVTGQTSPIPPAAAPAPNAGLPALDYGPWFYHGGPELDAQLQAPVSL